MSSPPPDASVREVVEALAAREGETRVVEACAALLDGAPPESCSEIAVGLTGHHRTIEQLRASGFRDYWWPTWGARALLYVWSPSVAPAVVRGIGHDHWRPAEMCLKVSARRELAEAADGALTLTGHGLPRVRAVALRTLGLVGDTEHVPAVRSGLDDEEAQVRRAAVLALERMVVRLDLPGEELP
jgi:HEAT repeat protein